jgi:hypothetical protein
MLEWNDAYRKSDEFQRFEEERVRRESLAQVATPVVQRQVAEGVIQREEQEPVEWSEESAAVILTEDSPELASLLSQYSRTAEETRTIHGVITDVVSMERNRERRLRESFGERDYGRYVAGRKGGTEFGAVWKGLQSSFFDTGQLLRRLYTWAYTIGSGIANFTDGMDAGLVELDSIEADSNEYYRALARPVIAHLRDKDPHYQLGYLMQIDQEMRLGRAMGFVLEIVLTELLGAAFISGGARGLRLIRLKILSLGPNEARILRILRPGGKLIGAPGSSKNIRIVQGTQTDAMALFQNLARGGKPVAAPRYPGEMIEISTGGRIGFRKTSSSGPPTIDVFIRGLGIREIKFLQ